MMDKGRWHYWEDMGNETTCCHLLRCSLTNAGKCRIDRTENPSSGELETSVRQIDGSYPLTEAEVVIMTERLEMIAFKLREITGKSKVPAPETIEVRIAVAVGSDGGYATNGERCSIENSMADESRNSWAGDDYREAYGKDPDATHTIVAPVPRPKPEPSVVVRGMVE